MFVNDANPGEAISAVKALSKANAQGQQLFHITAANRALALPQLNLDSATLNDITRALDTGLEVITHTDPVSVPGWSGAGYIIVDPEVGDGAYLISGGTNGSFLYIYDNESREIVTWGLLAIGILAILQPLTGTLAVALLAIQLIHIVMTTMIIDLALQEAGCP